MTYKIPKADVLAEAIQGALREQSMVISQTLLTKLVVSQLKRMDPQYTASEERIRRIAVVRKLAKLVIETREADERSKKVRCPVCGSKTKKVQNETIYGGTVTLGYKCQSCGYWTGMKRRVPVRYTFYGDGTKFASLASSPGIEEKR